MSPIFHQCMAAIGWLELGNWQEAYNELENLPAEQRAHPEALKLYCRVWAMAERWSELAIIAEGAATAFPDIPDFHWQFAWAKYKTGEVEPWVTTLLRCTARFSDDDEYAYRLACLLAVAGRIEEARQWLEIAIDGTGDKQKMKLRALEQPELEGVWRDE